MMTYGAEIWGQKEREREEIERIGEKYLRWMLSVDGRTPKYLVREKLQREKMRKRVGERARGFKKKLESGKESKLARWY